MDRMQSAISHYVIRVLGKQYVEPPITNLADVLASTTPVIPIVLIVQPGSDPQSQLASLAQSLELGHNRIKYLSMGQGQEPVSTAAIGLTMIPTFLMKSDNSLHLTLMRPSDFK